MGFHDFLLLRILLRAISCNCTAARHMLIYITISLVNMSSVFLFSLLGVGLWDRQLRSREPVPGAQPTLCAVGRPSQRIITGGSRPPPNSVRYSDWRQNAGLAMTG